MSGKWVQRVPKSLHAKLAAKAEKEGVSLNTLVVSLIAEGLGRHGAEWGLEPPQIPLPYLWFPDGGSRSRPFRHHAYFKVSPMQHLPHFPRQRTRAKWFG